MSLARGHVRLLRELHSADSWYRPTRVAVNRECVELHAAGYLYCRSNRGHLEYRINPSATVVQQAAALGILA